jgi:penicillin amidase
MALKAVASLVVIAIAAVAGAYVYLRRSLPEASGEVMVSGITGPVDIVRDGDNVPHIFAASRADALYGLGYVHAQDRLWQMEFQRRIGHGRLSEIFGAATLPQDRFLRTVGFGRAARSAWEHLPLSSKAAIDAYVAGINAFLDSHKGSRLPPEFTLLRFEPEPWTGADILVWVKMMAWDLSANYALELLRYDIAARVGDDRLRELMRLYPADGLSIVSDWSGNGESGTDPAPHGRDDRAPVLKSAVSAPSALDALVSAVAGHPSVHRFILDNTRSEALGSNSWVVSGARTVSGKPLLANDPHLGAGVPSLWYLAHLSAGDFDVVGATLPGAPAVAIGRNRFIAWGETNVAADVQDLYRERLNAAGTHAEFRGGFEPLTILKETITVSGSDSVVIDVRISRHGPLVSDAINANNEASEREPKLGPIEPLAFRWTALDAEDTTVTAFLRLNEARNWQEFTAALEDFVVPSQNFVYADVDGHIGYYAPGRIPIRARGDGSSPAEGWSGEMEWTGWIPFGELPHVFDPADGLIVTANHRPMPASYPHLIGLEFPQPYRAERLEALVRGGTRLTANDFRNFQADTVSLHARAVLPLMLASAAPSTDLERRAVDVLRAWDFNASPSSVAPSIFQAWFLRLAPRLAGDELGPSLVERYDDRYSYVTRFVVSTLSDGSSPWCDDVTTAERRESCSEIVTAALADGLAALSRAAGSDPGAWRWSGLHQAVFPHQGLDAVGLLRPFLSRRASAGGDWSTVNVGPVNTDQPFDQTEIPGYRQIVDLSPANDSRFSDAVGQSGHFLSPHYDDALDDWVAVRHLKMRMDRRDAEIGALGTVRLLPRGNAK